MSTAELSVVIPSVNGWTDLEHTLSALARTRDARIEVIVVDRVGASVREPLTREFPEVTLIAAERGDTIPAMRRLGFERAAAPVVGVIEDHVVVPPDWAARMIDEHRRGAVIVGGSVRNEAVQKLVDRAAFLCEYSHCLQPPSGECRWLTGNNVTYRRDLLERFRDVIAAGGWEDRLHDAVRDSGIPLLSRPEISVGHRKFYTLGEYVSQRYLYARAYAGMRVAGQSAVRRAFLGLAAFALPPLLLYRILSRARSARVPGSDLRRSLPLLALFVCAWSAGEIIGYWAGDGDTLAKVC